MESINVNLDNLTPDECEQLLKLVEKGNKPKSKVKSKVWKPDFHEGYWTFNTMNGGIEALIYSEDEVDNFLYFIGHMYATQAEVEFALERMKVLAELERYAQEHNDNIDWDNHHQNKYYIFYDHEEEKIDIYSNQFLQSSATYFTSDTIALEAVESIGEARIKKYLFNITD